MNHCEDEGVCGSVCAWDGGVGEMNNESEKIISGWLVEIIMDVSSPLTILFSLLAKTLEF